MGVAAEDAVMVGDSWANDIVGALNAGIRAVWFNPDRKPAPGHMRGVSEIHALAPAADVLPLLLVVQRVERVERAERARP
jgi:putative hydrolase of the HAD superfamily